MFAQPWNQLAMHFSELALVIKRHDCYWHNNCVYLLGTIWCFDLYVHDRNQGNYIAIISIR